MKISIVIPALNEEKYLPKLLESIVKQSFKGYEVVVADAGSKDKTRKIAASYGARIVQGGTPGVGRNKGAEAARGEFIFFLDADVILPKDFLRKAHDEIMSKGLKLATCEFRPISSLFIDKILHDIANITVKVQQFTKNPLAAGCCILVSKKLFTKVGGFDESLKMSEDHYFIKKAAVASPLRVLNSTYVRISVRRLTKEGRDQAFVEIPSSFIISIIQRPFKRGSHNLRIWRLQEENKMDTEKKLIALERKLQKINNDYKRYINHKKSSAIVSKPYSNRINKIAVEFDKAKNMFFNSSTKNRKKDM